MTEEAETIAVLPFNASGPGVEVLGEGMVDLLATNLQGVGGIQTVEPRQVLKRWGGSARAEPAACRRRSPSAASSTPARS